MPGPLDASRPSGPGDRPKAPEVAGTVTSGVASDVASAVNASASGAVSGGMIQALFAVASRGETGVFFVEAPTATSRLEIERGWIHAMTNVARADSGEAMLERLFARVPAAETGSRFARRAEGGPLTGHRVRPFHPARVVRVHLEKIAPPSRDFTTARLRIGLAPHGSCLEAHEQRVVALLATPRRLDELLPVAARPHLEKLLAFLDAVGALVVEDAGAVAAYATLGLADGASSDEIRRAYHRLARDLHPDLHPDAGEERRRALVERFHAVAAAYRRLLGG